MTEGGWSSRVQEKDQQKLVLAGWEATVNRCSLAKMKEVMVLRPKKQRENVQEIVFQ
ncbi:MAG: hypothetical protein NVSMB44_20480 [Ktedonobacteraceae bacterium]